MGYPPEIVARDVEGYARGKTGGAGGSIETGAAASDAGNLGAEAERGGEAPRFVQLVEDVLAVGLAVWVLDGSVHARKHSQIVQAPLGIGDGRGRQRIAGVQFQEAVDDAVLGCPVAAVDHLPHELLGAFVNHKTQIHAVGLRCRLRIPLECGIGKAFLEVLRQNRVPIHRDVEFAEGLTLDGTDLGENQFAVQFFDPAHLQVIDEILRPLLDRKEDGDFARLPLVVVLRPVGDFHIAKSIGLVEVANGVLVARHQVLAVAAVRELQK